MDMKLNDKNYRLVFNMNSIKAVMQDANMEDFSALSQPNNLAQQLDFGLICAYHGINEAAECDGEKKPFILIADLGRQIKTYNDLLPAIEAFTESVKGFFVIEDNEGK